MASFRAQLSPNEEATLRRIALDTLEPGDVREADAKRLTSLGLIQETDGLLLPTSRGLERLQIENPAAAGPQSQRRLKTRRVPL